MKWNNKVLSGLLGGYVLVQVGRFLKGWVRRSKLSRKGRRKLEERNKARYELPDIETEVEELILGLTVSELSEKIRNKELSSLQIVVAYIRRALSIGRELNSTAEECFVQAMEQAAKCDEETANGISRGVLHGIPVSIKDHYGMKGFTSSCGLAWKLDYPDTEDAVLVQLLVDQGAIPFVRSNVCQAMIWIETSNGVYGRSLNPWDTTRTTGGSSGGEGGLVSSRCSPLGIGSDIGGSIRTPCAFCGVYGFKVTPKRISTLGIYSPSAKIFEGFECGVKCSYGPIGRCVDDLALVIKSWFCERLFELDPTVVPLKFNESEFKSNKRLKVGYFTHIPGYPVAECIKAAVLSSLEGLEDFEVVQYDFFNAKELIQSFLDVYAADARAEFEEELNGERPENYYNLQLFSYDHPRIASFGLSLLEKFNNARLARFFDQKTDISSRSYVDIYQKAQDACQALLNDWTSKGIDAVICPVFGLVAPQHDTTVDVAPCLVYSFIMNLLSLPTGIVPVGTVKKGEDFYKDEFNDLLTSACSKVMENSEGLPYAVQVVGLPYKDEVVLRVMKKVEKRFGFNSFGL